MLHRKNIGWPLQSAMASLLMNEVIPPLNRCRRGGYRSKSTLPLSAWAHDKKLSLPKF
jgi:hypothetical protein